ncbi:hypothetical protein [Stenotrophomonas sp. PS02298]|uniref:hypothetical protein n=1 Tax=Stenotrophomonas sp. PS02298 TaxID=2991424 RepID=UPI00249CF1E1|nr:hypothetical protein [Stenotrophomonas sp. PS02298]
MANEILSLPSGSKECRVVFCGPPPSMLAEIFKVLAGDGRLLSASMADGTTVSFPVVVQVDEVPDTAPVARVDQSGYSLFHGLASLRNDPRAGIFLTLVPPGGQASDTHESTRKSFGVASVVNEGGAPISVWWGDPFIQRLVDAGLGIGDDKQLEQAKRLVHEAVVAADAAKQHEVSRSGAWDILDRLWELRDAGQPLDARVSLASGFPPSSDGRIDATHKLSIFSALADKFERSNLGFGVEQLKEQAPKAGVDPTLLDAFLGQVRRKCDVVTALKRSMPYCYAPDETMPPPGWWDELTVQKWELLLDDDTTESSPEITLTCTNPLAFQLKGFVPVVRDAARLQVQLPDGLEGARVRITREAPGGMANRRTWDLPSAGSMEFVDEAFPLHRMPIKYVAEVVECQGVKLENVKKASSKLISLSAWEPGLIVCSRTAAKGKVPKLVSNKPIDTILEMAGAGRHYLDVYARPGVKILSGEATAHCDDEELEPAKIGNVADDEYGLEVEAGGERHYQFEILRPENAKKDVFRIFLVADEATAEECTSYFEFHLARNSRREGGKLPRAVHANSQSRSAQLQGWMLERSCVGRSHYPFVLAPDYASEWRRREWSSAEDVIFSSARFLSDPRPGIDEMQPPTAFTESRQLIAAKVRGKDGNDLVESANLGEWLVTDKEFEEAVGTYVRAYLDWLSASPKEACWCDIGLVMGLESDGVTLEQVPNAVIVSPLHPIRFAWQCLAQRAMYLASRKRPCPAASIMDPDCVPDSIALPLRDATGGTNEVVYFSVECSSDYWGILWNTQRLDRLAKLGVSSPLDREMGLLVGGISSGFSASQVHRAMDDVCEMLVAKPVIGVLVSSAAGQNNACNDGLLSWGREHFSAGAMRGKSASVFGASEIHVFDERNEDARPGDAEISNLAEDTNNSVQWYEAADSSISHDLAIIAQLETSNASSQLVRQTSPLGAGGLVRVRIREQQAAGNGQFLSESRVAGPVRVTGDGLADNTAKAIAALEGMSDFPKGYVFAPSINAVKKSLDKAEFAAVSSSAVDPACFLGNWLEGTYLWDYELPSYSGRSGDSNGYYLLSRIKSLDLETMKIVLQRLPGCEDLSHTELSAIVQEVARRGIPTVRGLSAGNSGATGDLGLFIATRLIQDSFRSSAGQHGLLVPWEEHDEEHRISLVIPVDPFQRYLDDLAKANGKLSLHRPDLIVVGLVIADSSIRCKLTPVEVKNRSGNARMAHKDRLLALEQAKSLSALLSSLRKTYTDDQEMLIWRLAYENLLSSMIGYGFRVYSQHLAEGGKAAAWARLHSRVMEAILNSELGVEIDARGRLIVIDGTTNSGPSDTDGDSFKETIELSQSDASLIVRGTADAFYQSMKASLHDWQFMPREVAATAVQIAPLAAPMKPEAPFITLLPVQPAEEPVVSTSPSEVGASTVAPYDDELQETQEPSKATAPNDGSDQAGLILRVGEDIGAFQARVRHLNLGQTSLNQLNMGVVGDLGTGKTQLLQSLVFQIATGAAGNRGVSPNILIFDYKKDYSSEEFVKATGARVIRPQHIPLNLFDLSNSSQSISPWLDRYRFFSDAIEKIYSGIGAVQREKLKNAIKEAYNGRGEGSYPTIYDVFQNYQLAVKGSPDSITGILSDMVDMELFANDPASIVSPDEFLKGVVVIALNELGPDDKTKSMLVTILLNVFYEHMLKIPKRPFLGVDRNMRVVDSMLLVDEADSIMKYEFDVLRRLLLQGREFGVGVILASQYLSHFKVGATDYREPLLTWFLHKVPNLKPQELSALGLSEQSSLQQMTERIKSLNIHECMYKTHDVSGEFLVGAPFYKRDEWG